MVEGKVVADVAWHAVKRTVSVILVIAILVLPPIFSYQYGYRKGYSQCAKDNPTYGSVGTVVNNAEKEFKAIGIRFNIWKLRLNLGL
jgi:hypothetical protein